MQVGGTLGRPEPACWGSSRCYRTVTKRTSGARERPAGCAAPTHADGSSPWPPANHHRVVRCCRTRAGAGRLEVSRLACGAVEILGVDVGGSGIKAAPVDVTTGALRGKRRRI